MSSAAAPAAGIGPLARERRHTLAFLDEIRAASPVFLGTDVDLTRVLAHRADARAAGTRYSVVTYILYTAARTLMRHPEANAVLAGGRRPKLVRVAAAHGKLTLDKEIGGHRVVLSSVLENLDAASLQEIQRMVDECRDADPETAEAFAPARGLHRLPLAAGRTVYRMAVRAPRRRPTALGTFAVTSLGHGVVDDFYSFGGPTITLGVGRYMDRPIAHDGAVHVAPMLRLCLTFDHRVIDGAEAADVLSDLAKALEEFDDAASATDAEGAVLAAHSATGGQVS